MNETNFTQEDYILLLLALNKLDRTRTQNMINRLADEGQNAAQVMATIGEDKTLLSIRALKDKVADKILPV